MNAEEIITNYMGGSIKENMTPADEAFDKEILDIEYYGGYIGDENENDIENQNENENEYTGGNVLTDFENVVENDFEEVENDFETVSDYVETDIANDIKTVSNYVETDIANDIETISDYVETVSIIGGKANNGLADVLQSLMF